jgi:uncharacterized protein (TIGR03437 family)
MSFRKNFGWIVAGFCFLGASAVRAQSISIVSGNGQLVTLQSSDSLQVIVRDASGNPLPNAEVAWTVATTTAAATGSLTYGKTTTTDSTGQTLNTLYGTIPPGESYVQFTVTASYTFSGRTLSVQFFVTTVNVLGGAPEVQVKVVSPTSAQLPFKGAAGQQLATPVSVSVLATAGAEQGHGIPNVSLSVIANSQPNVSNPPMIACATGTVLTSTSGTATCIPVLSGGIGSGSFTVSVGGSANFPGLPFQVTLGAPALFTLSGNNQNGNPGQTLPRALVAQLTDLGGNLLPAIPVAFTAVVPGTVILSNVSTATDSNGRASATATLGNVPGPVQVKISTLDGKASNLFNLTVNLVLGGMTAISGDKQTANVNTAFEEPLIVQVTDPSGKGLPGVQVTFAVTSGSATLGTPSTTTSAQGPTLGQASTTVLAGATPGPVTVTATTTSTSNTFTQTFNLTVSPLGPQCNPSNMLWNGASFVLNRVSPGSIATITCKGLAPGVLGSVAASNFGLLPLPVQVANVTVQFDDHFAPIFSVNNINGQESVNVQVPFEITPGPAVPVTITVNGQSTTGLTANIMPGAPGIFQTVMSDSVARAVALRPDGSVVEIENPAQRGEEIRTYVTGLIPAAGSIGTDMFAPLGSDIAITTPVIVGVNNAGVLVPQVVYARDMIGVWEVHFIVPEDTATGNNVPFAVAIPVNGKLVFGQPSKIPVK